MAVPLELWIFLYLVWLIRQLKWVFWRLFRNTEIVKGVKMWVKKDNVQGYTFYQHWRSPLYGDSRGILPYIVHSEKDYWEFQGIKYFHTLRIKIQMKCEGRFGDEVLLNTQGVLATANNLTMTVHPDYEQASRQHSNLEPKIVHEADFGSNPEWYAALKAVDASKLAVLRFTSFRPTRKYRDFKVAKWNKQLITDMLKAWELIIEEETKAASSSPSATGPADVIRYGPFVLMPDGSVTDEANSMRLPPGIRSGGIAVDGGSLTIEAPGRYLITLTGGDQFCVTFMDGRWCVLGHPGATPPAS